MKRVSGCVWVSMALAFGCGDDAASGDAGGSGMDASVFDAGSGGDAGCTMHSQCIEANTTPPRCSEVYCEGGRCVHRAIDRDGDGLAAADCTSTEATIEVGTDCNDLDARIAPGLSERCNALDDDCDPAIDEDIAPDASRPCEVGSGVCRASGGATCVMGEWRGCGATALPPDGDDYPRCDGMDYDCDGVANTGCRCTTGEDLGECVQQCGRARVVCAGGEIPACDPLGGETPHMRCWDADADGHFAPGATCQEFCSPGTTGTVMPWSGEARWLEVEGHPFDDCDDSRADVAPGEIDADCDGVDQDCSGSEPPESCGRCGDIACGTTCSRCPAGFVDSGGTCRQEGSYEESFAMGDALRGDYGGGRVGGWYAIPGTPGVDVGNFSFRIWHRRVDPGGCCYEGDAIIATLQCDDASGARVRTRNLLERDFWRSDFDLLGSQLVTESGPELAGGACWFNLVDNRRYCCCGCIRRFNQLSAYATTPACL